MFNFLLLHACITAHASNYTIIPFIKYNTDFLKNFLDVNSGKLLMNKFDGFLYSTHRLTSLLQGIKSIQDCRSMFKKRII